MRRKLKHYDKEIRNHAELNITLNKVFGTI